MGEKWTGGDDMANSPGGGFKVNLLKEDLDQYKDRDDLILMFTDSYDVVILGDAQEIIKEFEKFDPKVVFGVSYGLDFVIIFCTLSKLVAVILAARNVYEDGVYSSKQL